VQELQGIQQVYTVGADNKVHVSNVTLGPQYGNDWVITSGLQSGQRIVLSNLQKLKEGVPVSPHEVPAPAPTPSSSTSTAGR
jgi:membrane fusion protein (multidrug efflux system)